MSELTAFQNEVFIWAKETFGNPGENKCCRLDGAVAHDGLCSRAQEA